MSGTTCYYCQLVHHLVEAGGVHYCPNRLCNGPGGWGHRAKMASYRELADGKHTVDADELVTKVKTNPHLDLSISLAEQRMIPWWKEQQIKEQQSDVIDRELPSRMTVWTKDIQRIAELLKLPSAANSDKVMAAVINHLETQKHEPPREG